MEKTFKAATLFLVVLLITPIFTFAASAQTAAPPTSCDTIYIRDMTTGSDVYTKRHEERVYPGGIIKLMTALVVIERAELSDIVTVSATASDPSGSSSGQRVKYGEEMTVLDLLYMMMLSSSNEAANALAEHVSTTIDDFVALMNERALELGMTSTNFVNPTGFHDDEQYTTASDMALLGEAAYKNGRLMDILNTTYIKLSETNLSKSRHVYNENHLISQLLQENTYFYREASGMSFGYTSQSGYCLITSSKPKKNGLNLIAVVMGGSRENKTDLIPTFVDAKNLLKWALDTYEVKTILKGDEVLGEANVRLGKTKDYVTAATNSDITVMIPKGSTKDTIIRDIVLYDDLAAPINKGDVIGSITLTYEGVIYAKSDLYALYDVERSGFLYALETVSNFFKTKMIKIIIAIIILIIIFYVAITVLSNIKRQRRLKNARKRRLRRRM